jgi:hypothetical protein
MIKKLNNFEMFEMTFHQLVMKKKVMKDRNENIFIKKCKKTLLERNFQNSKSLIDSLVGKFWILKVTMTNLHM